MSFAFTGVLNSKWNEEVVEYLASKFNSVYKLSKSRECGIGEKID